MLLFNYIALFFILIMLIFLYNRFLHNQSAYWSTDKYDGMRRYLLDKNKDTSDSRPILWIFVPYDHNSRKWSEFGSRSSTELNQPYLYLTVKSIIQHCDKSFNICIIDDASFANLLPKWKIDMNAISAPIKVNMRRLGIARLIYYYGGVSVPISFLCTKDLMGMYERETRNGKCFVCENYNTSVSSQGSSFFNDVDFMGAPQNNKTIEMYVGFLQRLISSDHTHQPAFLGDASRWCDSQISKKYMRLVSGIKVGTKTLDGDAVIIDSLLTNNYIQFYDNMYGIWIPADEVLRRTKYEWFARMSPKQILMSDFILAKYFILALAPAPDSMPDDAEISNPDWINFWRVPLTNGGMNLYGHKPLYLGNNVPKTSISGRVHN